MKPTHDFSSPRQIKDVDRVFYTDSEGHVVSEEYWKKCPKCGGSCMVHRSFDGTAGSERCVDCDYALRW